MIRSIKVLVLSAAAAASLALAGGCENMPWNKGETKKMDATAASAVAEIKTAPAASTRPSWGKPSGTVTFTQAGANQVKVAYDLKGLPPGKHGFHIHDKADLSAPDYASAGPHFNPTTQKHAGPETPHRHAGDLGNIEADTSGNAKGSVTVDGLSIGTGAANDIVNRSVVVHEKADDLKTDPSGNSGARVGAGVIELKK